MTPAGLDPRHAVRIAYRLARQARQPDPLLRHGMITRLWSLLETYAPAREAYRCPHDRTLMEHAHTLTPEELEVAAERLTHPQTDGRMCGPDDAPASRCVTDVSGGVATPPGGYRP